MRNFDVMYAGATFGEMRTLAVGFKLPWVKSFLDDLYKNAFEEGRPPFRPLFIKALSSHNTAGYLVVPGEETYVIYDNANGEVVMTPWHEYDSRYE